MMDVTPSLALGISSGFVVASLGAFVGWVGRFRGANLAFALFATGWGLGTAFDNVLEAAGFLEPAADPVEYAALLWPLHILKPFLMIAASGGLVGLLWHMPKGRTGESAVLRRSAVAGALAITAIWVWGYLRGAPPHSVVWHMFQFPFGTAIVFLMALLALTVLVLARRYRAHAHELRTRAEIVLFATAMALYPASYGPWRYVQAEGLGEDPIMALAFLAVFLTTVVAAAAWLVAGAATRRRAPLAVAWATLAAGLAGAVIGRLLEPLSPSGPARFVAVLLLGYGIVRHQLLGIDIKVRWTISKTTLAGIFVAVFFVASEAAQEFFGTALANNYIGILAAGLLVFAIAPLSRFADRVAERAVPLREGTSAGDAYREALRIAMRDRSLDPDEEVRLAALAERLGLGAARATQILHDVKRESARRDD